MLFIYMNMLLTYPPGYPLPLILNEDLTDSDKAEVKRMVKSELKKMVEDEVSKSIGSKTIKDDIGDITKKVLKKLYKDLSFHHPYIIDRIKI